MAAASAWYRKQTRWFLFLAGIVLAGALNVDALHAATTLYRDDQARAAVVSLAERVSEVTCTSISTTTSTRSTTTTSTVAPSTAGRSTATVTGPLNLSCV